MKKFRWDETKNKKLKKERNLSFEDVIDAITNDDFYGIFENQSKNHPTQRVLLVKINGYPCIVPFIESDSELILKTIIPDRRFKKYLKES